GGSQGGASFSRRTSLPDGRALRADILLLSDDGTIQRRIVERVPMASAGSGSAPDPAALMRIAERFAEQMDVEPDQIGLMGNTVLEHHGEAGPQVLMVRYAWQRRSAEAPKRRSAEAPKPAPLW